MFVYRFLQNNEYFMVEVMGWVKMLCDCFLVIVPVFCPVPVSVLHDTA